MIKYVFLIAAILQLVAAFVSVFGGDIVLFNTHLILSFILLDLFRRELDKE